MQDTIYNNKGFTILKSGTYKSHNFMIVTLGHYPIAYVKILAQVSPGLSNAWEKFDFLKVHGGINYIGKCYLKRKQDNGQWIGWCYGQSGDYNGNYPYNSFRNLDAKKWTIKEIYEEVKSVIDQIIVVKDYALYHMLIKT